MKRRRRRGRKNRINRILGLLLLLVICLGIYPGLRALYQSDLLPQQYRPIVRKMLRILDVENGTSQDSSAVGSAAEGLGGPETLPQDALVVDCIDVGQGDCTLIRQGEHAMLFDCGCEVPVSLRGYFQEQGIKSFDMIWLSHADADHISAFPSVAYEFDIGRLFTNAHAKETVTYEHVMESVQLYVIPTQVPEPGETYSLGDALIHVLGPLPCGSEEENDSSLAIRVEYAGRSILLCGDASDAEELAIAGSGAQIASDILHVSHHGSNLSSSSQFLDAVYPEYAVISCAEGNDYGHPGTYTLQRLASRGIRVFRTDINGTIRFTMDAAGISVQVRKQL